MTAGGPHSRGRPSVDALLLATFLLVILVVGMPMLKPIFAALYPSLDRPMYETDSFVALTLGHLALVGASSLAAALIGGGAGIFVTRRAGLAFRGLLDRVIAIAQTVPPVAVLALSVPAIGFGFRPALIALTLYALLPIAENTIAGLGAVPDSVRDAARGLGMHPVAVLLRVELPLASPVILAGVRTAVIINVGTTTVASTVGAKTLGLPIIVGLNGSNGAYVLQGAIVVACLAVVIDMAFGRLDRRLSRWARA